MTGTAIAVTGHLRPGFYMHSVPPSPPDFVTACASDCLLTTSNSSFYEFTRYSIALSAGSLLIHV